MPRERVGDRRRGCHKTATVSRLTGFSPDLLRAWESRHRLLDPARGVGGQRLYSDEDLAVLRAVRMLLDEGRSIGEIAANGRQELLAASGRVLPPSDGEHTPLETQAIGCLSARLDPAGVLDSVVETLAVDFQSALARIWVYEPEEHALYLRASAGLSKRTTESTRARINLNSYRYKVGVVARARQPFISNAMIGDPHFDQRWVRRERLASVAVLPLERADRLEGVIAAFFRVALHEQVMSALSLFANIAATSIAAHRPAAGRHRLCA
jgi:hypothetical protein